MVERLASVLKTVLDKKSDIDAVVSALEKAAPTSRERQESSKSLRKLPFSVKIFISVTPL